jgi:hypothetical protein
MIVKLAQTNAELKADSAVQYLSEALVEKIWHDLHEQVTHAEIRQLAAEVAVEFQDAAVSTFIPVFIYRQTYERLQNMLNER